MSRVQRKTKHPLMQLPEKRQEQIIDILRAHSYKDAVPLVSKLLQKPVSQGSLYSFRQQYFRLHIMQEADTAANDVETLLREEFPNASEDKIKAAGNTVFNARALSLLNNEETDAKTLIAIGKHLVKLTELNLDERRVKLLEQKAAQADSAKAAMQDASLTLEQRNAKMKEIFGIG